MSPALSIVIPCYNEADNVPFLIEQLKEAIPAGFADCEVVLVDNGSKDGSAEAFARELGKLDDSRFRVETVKENKGYGYGILAGLAAAKGQTLAWTHADLQTDPADVFRAYQVYRNAQDESLLVKGHRKKRRLAEAFFSWGMQVLSSAALGAALTEINAQPKLFSRTFYERRVREGAPHDFSLDLYTLYQAKRHGRIASIPVYFKKRLHGEAKGGGSLKTRVKLIGRTLRYIFELRAYLRSETL